jgi:1-acyl-sn-glycerol-3-phosphate acyltransferase
LQGLLRFLFMLVAKVTVTGLERVPLQGGLIACPNHLHWLDSPVLFAWFPRRITVFSADKWRGHPVGFLLERIANAIYVDRGAVDRHALRAAERVIGDGGCLAIAPEGTRSRTGGLGPGKDGAAFLAERTQAPVVPVAVCGQERLFHELARLRRPQIRLVIGEALFFGPESGGRTEHTEQIMLSIAHALPAAYRGAYAELIRPL